MTSAIFPARRDSRFLFVVSSFALSALLAQSRPATLWAGEMATAPPEPQKEHPLAEPLRFIEARREQIRREVRDFTCVLSKRERIDGRLQDMQTMRIKVCENFAEAKGSDENGDYQVRFVSAQPEANASNSGDEKRPIAIFVEFDKPKRLCGRRVLFVDGQNENQMIIRKGGSRLSNLMIKLACDSEVTRRESLNPITEMSFDRMSDKLVRRIHEAIEADPTGENTQVDTYQDVKVEDRTCTCIALTHPEKKEGLQWHVVQVFIDSETQLPIRLETYDWPESQDADPPLLSEFTYSDLKLNVGLSKADFTTEALTADEK